ncbi:HSF-type DNA-binding-domain-containing protein, partial [Leucosporidium creatinivorum]
MLLDPASHQYVRFSESGKSFVVFNQAGLSKHILPRHFKHSNFASFVRQLNMYSFHKVNRVGRGQTKAQLEALPSEFAHPLFEKGKPDQIDQIKRR